MLGTQHINQINKKGRQASLFYAPDLRPADPQRRKEPTLQSPLPVPTKSKGWKGESVPPSIAHYPIDAATLAKRETAWRSEEVHLPSTDQPKSTPAGLDAHTFPLLGIIALPPYGPKSFNGRRRSQWLSLQSRLGQPKG